MLIIGKNFLCRFLKIFKIPLILCNFWDEEFYIETLLIHLIPVTKLSSIGSHEKVPSWQINWWLHSKTILLLNLFLKILKNFPKYPFVIYFIPPEWPVNGIAELVFKISGRIERNLFVPLKSLFCKNFWILWVSLSTSQEFTSEG